MKKERKKQKITIGRRPEAEKKFVHTAKRRRQTGERGRQRQNDLNAKMWNKDMMTVYKRNAYQQPHENLRAVEHRTL